jgi:hypothetical protein
MPRKLNVFALMNMEGQKVRVHDLEYDTFDQICEVKMEKTLVKNLNKKNATYKEVITKLWLENEEFIFEFNGGKCHNGEFEVYSLT